MAQIRKVEVGEFIECVYKHKSSKKRITIGKTYEVVKVRKYSKDSIHGYYIINDDGFREYHEKHTHSFLKSSEIYSSNDLKLMKQFANDIISGISLNSEGGLPIIDKSKLNKFLEEKSVEYLKRIKLKKL